MLLEVRREQDLDAALRLLNQHGYAALTMEAVAKAVDQAKPRVYAAYPGLEPLLVTLLEREKERALSEHRSGATRPVDRDGSYCGVDDLVEGDSDDRCDEAGQHGGGEGHADGEGRRPGQFGAFGGFA